MTKKRTAKVTDTVELLKPYLERALRDDDFRGDLRDALQAARELYGPLTKGGGVKESARHIATDKKTQEQLMRAFGDLGHAAESLQGKHSKGKGRKAVLLAGIVAGALYNPWTGAKTREKLLDLIAGDDDLAAFEAHENFPSSASDVSVEGNGASDGNDADDK